MNIAFDGVSVFGAGSRYVYKSMKRVPYPLPMNINPNSNEYMK